MLRLIRSLLRHRRLVRDFVVRDLKARYVGSTMGFFWSVVYPIINLAVFMFVFRLILEARWGDRQGPAEVALVMLAGIVVWAAFAETVSRATNSLVENANLIQKVVFPAEVLPVYLTLSSLINMLIGLPVVLVCVGWFAFVSPPKAFLEVPTDKGGQRIDLEREPLLESHEPYEVSVQLTRGARVDVVVPFTLGGTATRGEDYLLDADEVVIPRGANEVWLVFTPLRDRLTEGNETIELTLGRPRGAVLAKPYSLGVFCDTRLVIPLGDGDAAPTVRPADVQAVKVPPLDLEARPLDLGLSLVMLPVLMCLQAMFTVGLGYLLATLNLFLRDTFHLVGVGIVVWMFGTPIFYPAHMVAGKGFGWILALNPMHWLIESYRSVLLYDAWPAPWLVVRFALVSLALLGLGAAFFSAQKPRFPDLL